jgi:tartrate-resistant acid phosphatase type 5
LPFDSIQSAISNVGWKGIQGLRRSLEPYPAKPVRHHDRVLPEEGVLAGLTDPGAIDARVKALGFDQPLPRSLHRYADKVRLHRRDDGARMLMHVAGEFAHLNVPLSPGGVKLPTERHATDELRVVILGDSGTGDDDQQQVAGALSRYVADDAHNAHFIVHVGDAVYPNGVQSTNDRSVESTLEQPYGHLKQTVYMAHGNHEYGDSKGTGRPDDQMAYYQRDDGQPFVMPSRYYQMEHTFDGGRAAFFVLDTTVLSSDPEQLKWLKRELERSDADYNIVIGHHPIGSHGPHLDLPHLEDDLLPLLKEHADLYISGHEHDQQLLVLDGDVPQLVSGAGAHGRDTGRGPRTLAAIGNVGGFTSLDFTKDAMTVTMMNAETEQPMFRTAFGARSREARRLGRADKALAIKDAFNDAYKVAVSDRDLTPGLDALFDYHHGKGFFENRLDDMSLETVKTALGEVEFQLVPHRRYDKKKGGLEDGGCACPFCRDAEPVARALNWRGWRVLPNRYPYAPEESRHVVLAREGHIDQSFSPSVLADMIDYQRLAPGAHTLHYNGIAGNSQQHLHWHASDEVMPVERLINSGALALNVRRGSLAGQVATYDDGFYKGLHVEGSKDFVVRWASRLVDALDKDPTTRGHYNMLLLKARQDGQARLVIVPRNADSVVREVDGLGKLSYGAFGVAGRGVIIKDRMPPEAIDSFVEQAEHTMVRPDAIPGIDAALKQPELDGLAIRLMQSQNMQIEDASWGEHH